MSNKALTRWTNPAELKGDHDKALEFVLQQGVIISSDPDYRQQAREVVENVFRALPEYVLKSRLSLIYVYDQMQQPPGISDSDGYASIYEHSTSGRRVESIGISIQALQRGMEYAAFVFMHELTHITINHRFLKGSHGGLFHYLLNLYLMYYNRYHGTKIENDYYHDVDEKTP